MKRLLLGLLFSLLTFAVSAQNIIGYPPGASPITASATGAAGTVTATLPATTGRTTYICGFVITNGPLTSATAGSATSTVTGTVSGTLNFAYTDVSSGQGLLGVAFPQCQPASGPGVAIVITKTSSGATNITSAVSAWGYQQ